MRTAGELTFRARQELANLRLWLAPPDTTVEAASPLPLLPDPHVVVERLRGSSFESRVVELAELIRGHRFPVGEATVATGDAIEWRRDYGTGLVSDLKYFRLIPYLDSARVGNSRLVWELNRHQHLVVLAQAWLFTRRTEFLSEIEAQVESWVRDNPYMRGINWASALEVAFRALSWLWVFHLAGQELPQDSRRRIVSGLYRHGCYLEDNLSIYASPNTHLLGEAVALHAIGVLLPKLDRAGIWRATGGAVVKRQIDVQIMEDGAHFEQSSYYHLYALDFFLLHGLLERIDDDYRTKLERMAVYLDALMGSARCLPLTGDDDGGRVFHPYGPVERFGRATIATCATLLRRPWAFAREDLHEQAAWWMGGEVLDALPSSHTVIESRLFRASGLAAMRGEKLEVLVDAGRFGAGTGGHSHSDTLSVIASSDRQELLVDSGTFTYITDPVMREWFRSSMAHNTIRIDGRDQGAPSGPFRWASVPEVEILRWVSDARYDLLDAICRYGGGGDLAHRRRVLLLKGRASDGRPDILVVCDEITGPPGTHTLEQYWRPGTTLLVNGSEARLGDHATLVTPKTSSFEHSQGWRSRRFGAKEPAPGLVVRLSASSPALLWAALTLGDRASTISVDARASNRRVSLAYGQSVCITLTAADNGLAIEA